MPGRAGRNCRAVPRAGPATNNCSGYRPGSCWSAGGIFRAGVAGLIAGSPAEPGELTRTIPRVVVPGKLSASPNPDKMSICSRGAGKPDE